MDVTILEPFGFIALLGSVLYSVVVMTIQPDCYKFHFKVLMIFVMVSLTCFTSLKFIRYWYKVDMSKYKDLLKIE